MTTKENILKCVRFDRPDHIPMNFMMNPACWNHYDQEALKDLMEGHQLLFPNYQRPRGRVEPSYLLNARAGAPYKDSWDCVWETTENGIVGAVQGRPLESWNDLDRVLMPDPEKTDGRFPIDWAELEKRVRQERADGLLVAGGLPHGHTFLRLQDIRGYENLLVDMAEDHPSLPRLIGLVEEFNYRYVMKWMSLAPDWFSYAEDLGMQVGPMISPAAFRKYIKPVYARIMKPAKERGCVVHMHSDGDIRTLADDLEDAGVQVLNLQDLVNGIDWIAQRFRGRICVDLDIDRQNITRFGTPVQIDELIREEVEKLGSPRGGLMMKYGMYHGIPIENAKAVMDAMENYAGHYS